MYAVGDKVTLGPDVGGWTGYVGGITGRLVTVDRGYGERDSDVNRIDVHETQIVAGPLPIGAWSVGQNVSLNGEGGVIVSFDGTLYEVLIEQSAAMPNDVIFSRTHRVPGWRLDQENPA